MALAPYIRYIPSPGWVNAAVRKTRDAACEDWAADGRHFGRTVVLLGVGGRSTLISLASLSEWNTRNELGATATTEGMGQGRFGDLPVVARDPGLALFLARSALVAGLPGSHTLGSDTRNSARFEAREHLARSQPEPGHADPP